MTKEELQDKTNWLLIDRETKIFSYKLYVNWAMDLMLDGCELEELEILAGLDEKEHFEIRKYFELSAHKLGLTLECNEEVLTKYLHKAMRETLADKREVNDVLNLVFHLSYSYDFENVDLFHLANLYDYWEIMELPNGALESGFDDYAKNEFKIYLENNTNN